MEHENWTAVSDRYISEQAKADFKQAMPEMPADFDHDAYTAKWVDLTGRIEQALPIDPASAQARSFYDEWQALLAPFTAVASTSMMAGVSTMYDNIGEWQDEQKPPFSPEVWTFIKAAGDRARSAV